MPVPLIEKIHLTEFVLFGTQHECMEGKQALIYTYCNEHHKKSDSLVTLRTGYSGSRQRSPSPCSPISYRNIHLKNKFTQTLKLWLLG